MLFVATYSQEARTTLRNVCRSHADVVVQRFGRAVLFVETAFAGFLALRMRYKHGEDVQIERTEPFNEFADVSERIRTAARAYEERREQNTPYAKFAAGTELPDPDELRGREL
ncbi:Uncharacterized protein AArcCO_0026 [Halalkaliarchaeum sp. AArc-CO]|uniref:DUF7855 family protein n=1 Tax=Halalkaliarchaeum sp. AArc-CO TaxID=2866381 RepID=UPI00217D7941|nr:hypothetical protein [Halalkaliarchaeum sp. AArc-CO]UWG49358.1 Uncharacterized protein AArcCO_0026 [Halalkaliarchaeum sp. AArc-CO]